MSLIVIAVALAAGLVLTGVLLYRSPAERLGRAGHAHAPHEPGRKLLAAYTGRDELLRHIGMDYVHCVMLDGAVLNAGTAPCAQYRTLEKGGVVLAMPQPARDPRAMPDGLRKPCGSCGGDRARPPTPAASAPSLPPGAQELQSGFVADGSRYARPPAGTPARTAAQPAPDGSLPPDPPEATPQKAARA